VGWGEKEVGEDNMATDKVDDKADHETSSPVRTEALTRIYRVGAREVHALQGVNLEVEQGEFVALRGRSGSGKTTLLNCIGGLDRPTTGEVYLFGQLLAGLSERARTRLRRRRIGFVFQSFALLPTFSAFENVELPLRMDGVGRRARRERTQACLELVGLTRWADHRSHELSGGQQQRVGIARALANHPDLILADEPTGELDSATGRQILALFQRVAQQEGVTVLVATHDPMADDYTDQVYHLQDGRVVSL